MGKHTTKPLPSSSPQLSRGKKTKDANNAKKNNARITESSSASASAASSAEKNTSTGHLPPIFLVFTVMCCSGFLFVYAFRDVFATGRNIGGTYDNAYLTFTNSKPFFDDAKGWKSQQGGLSSISKVTTDANNMGGLFLRKVGGAAAVSVQLQKLLPLLFHPTDARWTRGHFRPVFITAVLTNLLSIIFYGVYVMEELSAVGADQLPKLFIAILSLETVVILTYLVTSASSKGPAVAMQDGKTPDSVVSRIMARTTLVVSGTVVVIAGRDLLFPGTILHFIPRDDIYLEWTGALLHSPQDGTPEADTHGMERDFFISEKFLSQYLALNMLLLCLYKFVAAFGIRYRNDAGGPIQAKMIWKAQAVGNALILYLFRMFSPAAMSASLDFRWHLMMIAYETLVLGLYGFL